MCLLWRTHVWMKTWHFLFQSTDIPVQKAMGLKVVLLKLTNEVIQLSVSEFWNHIVWIKGFSQAFIKKFIKAWGVLFPCHRVLLRNFWNVTKQIWSQSWFFSFILSLPQIQYQNSSKSRMEEACTGIDATILFLACSAEGKIEVKSSIFFNLDFLV